MAAAVSPSSSPRLPSPPPIAEDQVGPTSPGLPLFDDHGKFPTTGGVDTGASRRIRPGAKAEDMTDGPPLVDVQEIDSAFQLTEHLKALHHTFTHPEGSDNVQPITAEIAKQLTQPPPSTSKDIWLYELGRFLIQKTNAIIVALFADQPPCSAMTCPEMRASEWQYLCAVHDPPKSCAAIDYCCHTLDWAASTLTSSKMFPSRLGLGSGSGTALNNDKVLAQQMKEIKNIFRRVYRIYAHAWFQHREIFWRVETKTGLYVFFKKVCDEYGIIESENYTIPPEAEGSEPSPTPTQTKTQAPTILQRDANLPSRTRDDDNAEPAAHTILSLGDTTKRHRHTMSDRAASISTVIQEEAEEEDDQPAFQPSLGRQATALRDPIEPVATTTEIKEEDDEDEIVPGISRSDTMKPLKDEGQLEEGSSNEAVVELLPVAEEKSAEDTNAADEPKSHSTTEVEKTEHSEKDEAAS